MNRDIVDNKSFSGILKDKTQDIMAW